MLEEQNKEISDRIQFLVEKIEKFKIRIKEEPASSFHKEFIEVSEKLRDLLPELGDSSLFNIDDILYPRYKDWSDNDESKRMDNFKELCGKIDIETYLSAYFRICTGKDGLENVLCDNAYLKVIKHISVWDLRIKWTMESLLNDKIPRAVCRGLKLMKIVLDTEYSERCQTLDLFSLMSKFAKIPTTLHKNKDKEKIALFIADLANICYQRFECGYTYKPDPALSKRRIINNIHHIIYMDELSDVIRNSLYEVFTLQDDQKTRKKYLKYFLRAITSSPCQVSLDSGFDILIKGILWNIIHVGSDRMDKEMRIIDEPGCEINCYLNEKLDGKVKLLYEEVELREDVSEEERYLSYEYDKKAERYRIEYFCEEIKRHGFTHFCEEVEMHGFKRFREEAKSCRFNMLCERAQTHGYKDFCEIVEKFGFGNLFLRLSKYFNVIPCKESLTSEVKTKSDEESDYIFEKFFFYDDVMKNLQLLKIFCTAYSMRNSLCEGEFIGSDYSRGFSEPDVLIEQLGFYLNNPELLVPWHIEKTLKIFPLMIFEFGQKGLVIDLINILRGKEIPVMKKKLSKKIERMKALKNSLANVMRQNNVADYPKR